MTVFLPGGGRRYRGCSVPVTQAKGGSIHRIRSLFVDGLKHSLKYLYFPREEAAQKINFEELGTLEGFGRKTGDNIQQNKKAAIVYYYPPGIHFQVNCTVEVQKSGLIRDFINRAACAAHGENPSKWPWRTAYIFHVEDVIDKSVYPK